MIPKTTGTLVRILLLLVTTRAFTPTSRLTHLLPETAQAPPPIAHQSYHFSSTTTTIHNMDTTTRDDVERTITTSSNTKEQLVNACYGGDYAGHIATFSPTNGELIPIPEYYVPETLIEWGQIPSSFELLTSEDYTDITTTEEQEQPTQLLQLNRVGIKVLPAVGCGIDNLDTMVQKDSISISSWQAFESADGSGGDGDDSVVSSSILCFNGKTDILETVFVPSTTKSSSSSEAADKEKEDDESSFPYRIRVGIQIESLAEITQQQVSLKSPIEVTVERRTSIVSSKGKLIDGGGLTGSTVFQLIGKNVNKPFSGKQGIELDRLAGRWTTGLGGLAKEGEVMERDLEGYWKDDSICTLSLPGNVIVRYTKVVGDERTFPLTVEVSLVEDGGEEGNAIRRRVIQRSFEEDGVSTVQYWEEGKEADIETK